MANKSPIFPIVEPQHFSDYGFDPQIHYFQILEEARKHRIRETARSSIDTLHFKLQKPISKDESSKKIKKNSSRKRWWKNALLFFKKTKSNNDKISGADGEVHHRRPTFRGSISGPVYITESRSGSNTPYRTTSRPSSGPLAGTLTPNRKGDLEIPYINLREFNMDQQQQHKISTSSPMPIYLVT
ncbi:hypothetical protein H5410_004630 [Solanum commersonii]|uniref:Uncharacterized protein n=1 Tax=Solanum commersonii TaxID=4109 RepID=A0A9J6B8C1_SOLCO|nr:hypothetical protein H5410_004630 [Solanum commersonii]KAH0725659.1 hypothetical protein KY284_001524 [Solanum tuberosum]